MADPRITITLGRSGQVVKKAGTVLDSYPSKSSRLSGTKRSVRERLGGSVDSSDFYSKRHQGVDMRWRLGDRISSDDQVRKSDLRFKIMQRRLSRRPSGNTGHGEEREKVFRTVDNSFTRVDSSHPVSNPRESYFGSESELDFIPGQRVRELQSYHAVDRLRRRSPNRILRSYKGLSPPRHNSSVRQESEARSADLSKSGGYSSGNGHNTSMVAKSGRKAEAEPSRPTSKSTIVASQKSLFMGEESSTVSGLLNSLGLAKYYIIFQAEEVDMSVLKQMGDDDLKELGIPMGPRKKIMLALPPRHNRRPP